MIAINKLDERNFTVQENGGTIETFAAVYFARSTGSNGMVVLEPINARNGKGFSARFSDFEINGYIYPDATKTVTELNAFVGNFKRGGGTSETTPTIEPLLVAENGVYQVTAGVDGFNPVTVNVPSPVLINKEIEENGIFNASDDNANGYKRVIVNVPHPKPVLEDIDITENGTYAPEAGVDGFNEVRVNVQQPEEFDWVKEIFNADPDPNKRAIFLISDSNNYISLEEANEALYVSQGNIYVKTSDGAYYTNPDTVHTWNRAMDISTEYGYKVRWMMVYTSVANAQISINSHVMDILYALFGNNSIFFSFNPGSTYVQYSNAIIKRVEFQENATIYTLQSKSFQNCFSLEYMNVPQGTGLLTDVFYDCHRLDTVKIPSSVISLSQTFYNCHSLRYINIPVSIYSISSTTFTGCYGLLSFNIELGWIAPAFNLKDSAKLSVSSMIDMFKKLGVAPNARTITLGATNLNKLTPTEKAVATNKGYTLA